MHELESVYHELYPKFLRLATAISGSPEEGRDAVQDAFVGLLRSRGGYRGEGTIEAWAWAAVVNAARKRLRAVSRTRFDQAPAEQAGLEANLDLDDVARAVGQLPERQRIAMFLRYYADLDYVAIAAALDVAPGTVAATLAAAHRTLRQALKERHTNARASG